MAHNSALKTNVILHTSILADLWVWIQYVRDTGIVIVCLFMCVISMDKVCDCVSLCIRDVIRVTGCVALSDGRGDCA